MPDRLAIGDDKVVPVLMRQLFPQQIRFSENAVNGISELRDELTESNAATVTESNGQIKLTTGTNADGLARIVTAERGDYASGTFADCSLGFRMADPAALTGDQVVRWGYFDDDNGLGYGVDATGPFLFRRRASSDTLYRAADWNQWGSAYDMEQVIKNGAVFHNGFRWYGHGPMFWFIEVKDTTDHWAHETPVHQQVYTGETNIISPNLPIRVEADNAGTGTSIECFIGGRQFSLWGYDIATEARTVPVTRRGYSFGTKTATNDWEPIIAIRKKATYKGVTNAIKASIIEIEAQADGSYELLGTFAATTNSTYGNAPPDYPAAETAIEVDTGGFTVSDFGVPVVHMSGSGSRSITGSTARNLRQALGATTEFVLWARDGDATSLESVTVEVQERH